LPDATTLVLQGLLFANLLAWEAMGGRLEAWRIRLQAMSVAHSPVRLEGTHV
jgi:simple sugar transport system permease protein